MRYFPMGRDFRKPCNSTVFILFVSLHTSTSQYLVQQSFCAGLNITDIGRYFLDGAELYRLVEVLCKAQFVANSRLSKHDFRFIRLHFILVETLNAARLKERNLFDFAFNFGKLYFTLPVFDDLVIFILGRFE